MSAVKWSKITTDMFDNRKIKHLRRLPDGNNIILIWVMLLTMAGRCNADGMIYLTEDIPYTSKMLADELDFEENTVQLALRAMEQLGMIVSDNGFISIAGWKEYQNVEGMARMDEQLTKLKEWQLEKVRLYESISDRIRRVEDDNQRALLMCRYIKGMRWEDVASELGYTWRWTHKLHSKALDAIDIKEDIERQY